jgi:hypothetical protein
MSRMRQSGTADPAQTAAATQTMLRTAMRWNVRRIVVFFFIVGILTGSLGVCKHGVSVTGAAPLIFDVAGGGFVLS